MTKITSHGFIKNVIIVLLFSTLFVSTISIPGRNIYGASDLKILTVGNWGCTSNSQATVNNINSKNPGLVLGLGDYSYESTPDCWFNEIKAFDSKMKISIGNHDVINDNLLNSYLQHFGLSKQYYSFDFQNVHVITMATELDLDPGSEQYNFVKNDLELVSKNPNIKWIIVTMHKPIYTSPNGCSASSCEGSRKLSETYHPLFDKYGVDLVLQAHMHSYQRSFPIQYNAQDPSKPLITNYDKNNYNDPSGAIFAIVATGGINFHGLSGKAPFTASQQDDQFGALELTISNNGNKLVGKFYANNGKVTDEFNVVKTNGGTPISTSAQNTDLKAGIEVKEVEDTEDNEVKEVEDTEADDTQAEEIENTEADDTEADDTEADDTEDNEVKEVEDTEADDTQADDTQAEEVEDTQADDTQADDTEDNEVKEVEDTEAEDTDTEAEDTDTEADDTEVDEADDTEVDEAEDTDTEAEDTEAEEVEDTLVKEIKEKKDTLVKEIKEKKDTLVKEIKERLSLSELVQPKDWTEIDFSDPDSEGEENDGEEKEVDSDILDTSSLEKSSKSENKMFNPFASLTK